jgi:hypothetical protein
LVLVKQGIGTASRQAGQRFDKLEDLWTRRANQLDSQFQEVNSKLLVQNDTLQSIAKAQFRSLEDGQRKVLLEDKESMLACNFDEITKRLENMESASEKELSILQDLIKAVQNLQFETLRKPQAMSNETQQAQETTNRSCVEAKQKMYFLQSSTDRLCRLASDIRVRVPTKESRLILHDLGYLITFFSENILFDALKFTEVVQGDSDSVLDILNMFKAILISSQNINIEGGEWKFTSPCRAPFH